MKITSFNIKIVLILFLFSSLLLANNKTINYVIISAKDKQINEFLKFTKSVIEVMLSNGKYDVNFYLKPGKDAIKPFIKGEYDVLMSSPTFYINNKEKLDKYISKIYHSTHIDYVFEKFYLIKNVKNKIPFNSSKNITLHYPIVYHSSKIWFDKLSYDTFKRSINTTISKSYKYRKESKIINKIFFNINDYGLITKSTYDLMIDLNPQLKRNIKIIKSSKEMFISLFYISNTSTPKDVRDGFISYVDSKSEFMGNSKNSESLKYQNIREIKKDELKRIVDFYNEHNLLQNKYEK